MHVRGVDAGGCVMKLPTLPEPTIVDGRTLYTAGQMREYGKRCYEAGLLVEPTVPGYTKTPHSDAVNDLMSRMGMK